MILNCHQQSRLRGSLFVAIVLQCYIDLQRQCVSVKEKDSDRPCTACMARTTVAPLSRAICCALSFRPNEQRLTDTTRGTRLIAHRPTRSRDTGWRSHRPFASL